MVHGQLARRWKIGRDSGAGGRVVRERSRACVCARSSRSTSVTQGELRCGNLACATTRRTRNEYNYSQLRRWRTSTRYAQQEDDGRRGGSEAAGEERASEATTTRRRRRRRRRPRSRSKRPTNQRTTKRQSLAWGTPLARKAPRGPALIYREQPRGTVLCAVWRLQLLSSSSSSSPPLPRLRLLHHGRRQLANRRPWPALRQELHASAQAMHQA